MSSPTTLAQQLATAEPVTGGGPSARAALRVVQLNCNLRAEVSAVLARYMMEMKIDIAVLQEQHLQTATGRPSGFPAGTRAYWFAGGREANKAAIVVFTPDIEVMSMDDHTCEFGTCVWTKGRYGEAVICSMYCKGPVDLEPYMRYLERVIAAAGATPLLVGMDANARSRLWHSKVRLGHRRRALYGTRRRPLEELIVQSQLRVLNEPSEWYTFSGPAGQSDIDVTLGNAAMARFQTTWAVVPGVTTSDHNLLRIEVITDHERAEQVPLNTRWSMRGAGQEEKLRFREHLGTNEALRDASVYTAEQLQLELDRAVALACEQCLAKERPGGIRRQQWWTAELSSMQRNVRRAREAYQRARRRSTIGPALTEEVAQTLRTYRTLEKAYGKRIYCAKADDWKRFVAEDGNANPWGAVYRICRAKSQSTSIGQIRTTSGEPTTTWRESAEALLCSFLPVAHQEQDTADPRSPGLPEPAPITAAEVEAAVARCNPRRAPGLDGMRADIVRQTYIALPQVVTALFNRCLAEGCFPDAWKVGSIVAFLKAPDKDRNDAKSYRPITLLSVLGKVFERVLVSRLQLIVADCPTQFGFTAGRSTVDAWLRAKELVESSQAKYVLGVFVDFRGAFDHLGWGSILQKLEAIGCSEIATWRSYFSRRRSCMVGRQEVVWRDVQRGCPQGSISGPTMWNLLMAELLGTLNGHGVRHVAYADDLLLVVEGRSRATLELAAAAALQHAVVWGAGVGVDVSFAKTEAMMLRGRFDVERMPIITVDDERVQVKSAVKYLGVWVTPGLRFERHLRETAEKLQTVIEPLRRVLKRDWGLKRKASARWLTGLMTPVVMYGSAVWYEAAGTARGRALMAHTHRTALHALLRVCRTVSTEAMQVLMGSTPWDLEAHRHALRHKCRRGLPMLPADMLTDEEAASTVALASLDQRIAEEWQRRWTNSEKGRVTHAFIPNTGPTNMQFDPPTRALFLLTGHGSMNAYLHKHTQLESPRCACGAASEDWRHILVDCPRYNDLRNLQLLGVTTTGDWLDVSNVLRSQDTYKEFVTFAEAVFRRRARQTEEQANAGAN